APSGVLPASCGDWIGGQGNPGAFIAFLSLQQTPDAISGQCSVWLSNAGLCGNSQLDLCFRIGRTCDCRMNFSVCAECTLVNSLILVFELKAGYGRRQQGSRSGSRVSDIT